MKFTDYIKPDKAKALNEKQIVNKKQLQWFISLIKDADNIQQLQDDIELMIKMSK